MEGGLTGGFKARDSWRPDTMLSTTMHCSNFCQSQITPPLAGRSTLPAPPTDLGDRPYTLVNKQVLHTNPYLNYLALVTQE